MATDSVVQFQDCTGKPLATIYVRFDSQPEIIIPELIKHLKEASNDGHKGRLNWDYLLPIVLSNFIKERYASSRTGKIKYCLHESFDVEASISYKVAIKPIEDAYCKMYIPIAKAVNVEYRHSQTDELVFSGILADFKLETVR